MMPTTINSRVEFLTTSGPPSSFTDSLTINREPSEDGRENLARQLFTEAHKEISLSVHATALPDAGDLLEPSDYTRDDPMSFLDIYNSPNLWLEIANTLRSIQYLLAQAKSYKEQEQNGSTPLSSSLCAHIHFAKMHSFDLAVFQLVKIQDLVVRLLHENFAGKLIDVDYDVDGWEKDLSMEEARNGLKTLFENSALSDADYQSILTAIDQPKKSAGRKVVIDYRNRLTHRIKPSVDYAEVYTDVQNRGGKPILDAAGKERGRTYSIGGRRTKPEFLFEDLYSAVAEYMGHIVNMVKGLKQVSRLSSRTAKLFRERPGLL
jgi:hypothetical protein